MGREVNFIWTKGVWFLRTCDDERWLFGVSIREKDRSLQGVKSRKWAGQLAVMRRSSVTRNKLELGTKSVTVVGWWSLYYDVHRRGSQEAKKSGDQQHFVPRKLLCPFCVWQPHRALHILSHFIRTACLWDAFFLINGYEHWSWLITLEILVQLVSTVTPPTFWSKFLEMTENRNHINAETSAEKARWTRRNWKKCLSLHPRLFGWSSLWRWEAYAVLYPRRGGIQHPQRRRNPKQRPELVAAGQ